MSAGVRALAVLAALTGLVVVAPAVWGGELSGSLARAGVPIVAYTRNHDGALNIYVARGGRGRGREVTRSRSDPDYPAGDAEPTWSPGGDRIAYVASRVPRGRENARYALAVIRLGRRSGRRVTGYGPDQISDPAWSPDGRSIAFTGFKFTPGSGIESLRVLDLRTHAVRTVPTPDAPVDGVTWSPHGHRIAFGGTHGLWSVRPDGGDPRRLTDHPDIDPAWSPDGRTIAFASTRDHNGDTCFEECAANSEVYLMRADGSHQRRLTHNRADDSEPSWTTGGYRLAFTTTRLPLRERNVNTDIRYQLFVMRRDGSCQTRLHRDRVWNSDPAWRPTTAPTTRPRLHCHRR